MRKFMDEFKVEIKFPRPDAEDPDLVEIVGAEDNVENAVQHLKNLEDELMEYVTEEKAYQRPQKQTLNNIFQVSTCHFCCSVKLFRISVLNQTFSMQ